MSSPIALLRDDFTNNTIDPLWSTVISGSAAAAETSGQARLTLPSSTAGSHSAYYRSTGTYDLTGDGFVWNIQTMVATGVAATVTLDLFVDGLNALRWRQLSNAITARTLVAGVDTQLFTATWSGSTYQYLRIRESGGTIFFDSSSNGTSWTNRASVANPFAITSLYVQFGASCGNVASPGSLRLDDVNLILPAPSATWRETTADWSISNRLRSVTLASDGGMQGVLVTADTMDSSRTLGGTVRYFAGPLGSSSGGFLQLTEYASLVLAQASAFPIPLSGRVDLPAMVDARYMRFYHRSTDASSHTIYEYVPRRLVQADDIEAESIKAINISAGAITADKISVLSLSAITASMGSLHMDGPIDITSGSLTGGGSTVTLDATGLGLTGPSFSYGLYNASPVTIPRANMVQWSKSSGSQAASIVGSASSQLLMLADKITLAIPLSASDNYGLNLQANGAHSMTADTFEISFGGATGPTTFSVQTASGAGGGHVDVKGGLNVGSSASGAANGQISTSGNAAIGAAISATVRLYAKGASATSSDYGLWIENSASSPLITARNDGYIKMGAAAAAIGFFGAAGGTKPTITGVRTGTLAQLQTVVANMLTGLGNLGLWTDSTT